MKQKFFHILGFSVFLFILLFAMKDRGGISFLSHAVSALLLGGLAFFFAARRRLTAPDIFLVLFLCWFILSLVFSETPEYGFRELLTFFVGFLTFLFFSEGWFFGMNERRFLFAGSGVLGIALLMGIGAFIFLPFERFSGPFLNFGQTYEAYPNDLASFFLLVIPLAVVFTFRAFSPAWRKIFLILSSFSLAAFFLTLSRGAFLAFIVAIVFFGIFSIMRKWKWWGKEHMRIFGALLLVAFLASGMLIFARSQYGKLANLAEKVDFESYEGGSAVRDRLEFWGAALAMIKTAPVFGHGPVSFKFFFPGYQKTFGIAQDQPHNFYLKTAAESGLPTLIFFLTFLSIIFLAALKQLWRAKDPFLLAALMGLSAALMQNFVDDSLNFILNAVFFWGVLGWVFFRVKSSFRPVRLRFFQWISLQGLTNLLCIFLIPFTLYEFSLNLDLHKGKSFLAHERSECGRAPAGPTHPAKRNAFPKCSEFLQAEAAFARAEKLIFKRDFRNYLLRFRERQYEEDDVDALKKWRDAVEEGTRQEPYNPEMFFSAGKLFWEAEGGIPRALISFRRAYELDPKNSLKYFYYFQWSRFAAGLPIDREKIMNTLEVYHGLLGKNAHLTVLTDNPDYAALLYQLLIDTSSSSVERASFQQALTDFKILWEDEKQKFSRRFLKTSP